jgi:phosphatidylinositol-3-phosphatase
MRAMRRALATLPVLAIAVGAALAPGAPAHSHRSRVPQIKHLFVIVLENENEQESFGADASAPYLARTLPKHGALLPDYFGIGHNSLDNYLAMISGQPPNPVTQADCRTFEPMMPGTLNGRGIALGQGCVFPAKVKTVAGQLERRGLTWHGYMEDMAAAGYRTCGHPAIGSADQTQAATPTAQYATRHDPFVYFRSIIDTPACRRNVVDLGRLRADLRDEARTPAYSFITPDLCADGHDATCADPAEPGGFQGIDAFLEEWIPRIEASAAYRDRGMILITFDESESGAESCCGETAGPNTTDNGDGKPGPGGGTVGAVALSPCIRPGTVSHSSYNHYSMLRWVEDNFHLPHLADARPAAVGSFGADILNRPSCGRRAR